MITPLAVTAATLIPAGTAAWFLCPMATRLAQTLRLRRQCTATRSLALTFDDGPGPDLTPRLLDLLAARGVRATFFLSGARAQARPDLADQIVDAGHEVGCHSLAHLNAWRTWPWRAVADIDAGYAALKRWMSSAAPFRPPYGKMTPFTCAAVRRRRARVGWWTISAGDVDACVPEPDAVVDRAIRDDGGSILLHDFHRDGPRARFVLQVTCALLDAAEQHGWAVRTLSQLDTVGTSPPATAPLNDPSIFRAEAADDTDYRQAA